MIKSTGAELPRPGPMPERIIHIAKPDTGEEEWQALRGPLESGWLTQGPKVAAFENAFAARHEVKHALATTSCTTALHLILAAMEIGPGDAFVIEPRHDAWTLGDEDCVTVDFSTEDDPRFAAAR